MRNQVQLIGNIGRTPEQSAKTKDGRPVVRFALAQDVSAIDTSTQKLIKKEPQWFQVSCFAGLAERSLTLTKGDLVLVIGELKSRSYETDAGEKRTSVEIIADHILRVERLRKSPNGIAYGVELGSDSPNFEQFDAEAPLL